MIDTKLVKTRNKVEVKTCGYNINKIHLGKENFTDSFMYLIWMQF